MGTGWIDNIYNHTGSDVHLKSVDDRHNGALRGDGSHHELDGGGVKILKPGHYSARWCGIPWYYKGRHYKEYGTHHSRVKFYTSEVGDKNYITFEDPETGRTIARQEAPKGQDFHCNMRFENGGVCIDIVNNNSFSAENATFQILKEGKWVVGTGVEVAKLVSGG